MASIKQIAITKERAIRSMQASAARIQAVHNDIAPLEITAWRDPQYNEAMQLEAIAKWLSVMADAIAPVTAITPSVIDDTPEVRERAANALNEAAVKFAVEFPMAAIEASADPTPKTRGRKKAE